jgi:hypothetical protein
MVVQGHPALLAGSSLHLIPGMKEICMQSKHSAVLVGQLTLLATACLVIAFSLILVEGGQWLYRCGVWLRAWINRYRNRTVVKSQSEIIASESLNPLVSEPGSDFDPVPDPWELPLLVVQKSPKRLDMRTTVVDGGIVWEAQVPKHKATSCQHPSFIVNFTFN